MSSTVGLKKQSLLKAFLDGIVPNISSRYSENVLSEKDISALVQELLPDIVKSIPKKQKSLRKALKSESDWCEKYLVDALSQEKSNNNAGLDDELIEISSSNFRNGKEALQLSTAIRKGYMGRNEEISELESIVKAFRSSSLGIRTSSRENDDAVAALNRYLKLFYMTLKKQRIDEVTTESCNQVRDFISGILVSLPSQKILNSTPKSDEIQIDFQSFASIIVCYIHYNLRMNWQQVVEVRHEEITFEFDSKVKLLLCCIFNTSPILMAYIIKGSFLHKVEKDEEAQAKIIFKLLVDVIHCTSLEAKHDLPCDEVIEAEDSSILWKFLLDWSDKSIASIDWDEYAHDDILQIEMENSDHQHVNKEGDDSLFVIDKTSTIVKETPENNREIKEEIHHEDTEISITGNMESMTVDIEEKDETDLNKSNCEGLLVSKTINEENEKVSEPPNDKDASSEDMETKKDEVVEKDDKNEEVATVSGVTPKKRGRPRKSKTVEEKQKIENVKSVSSPTKKRKAGRPKKVTIDEEKEKTSQVKEQVTVQEEGSCDKVVDEAAKKEAKMSNHNEKSSSSSSDKTPPTIETSDTSNNQEDCDADEKKNVEVEIKTPSRLTRRRSTRRIDTPSPSPAKKRGRPKKNTEPAKRKSTRNLQSNELDPVPEEDALDVAEVKKTPAKIVAKKKKEVEGSDSESITSLGSEFSQGSGGVTLRRSSRRRKSINKDL